MRTATYTSLVLLASGFAFCLISLVGGPINCSGGGCTLYADMEFMGLSFYAWGTMLFVLLIFAWSKTWFFHASMLALGADIPFLLWQNFMVPCTSCLTVSVLLTLNACLARAPARASGPVKSTAARRIIIITAIALIGCGCINLIKETTAPWSITPLRETGRYLYFSPSCEPCRKHIQTKVADGTLSDFSLIPIARSRDDIPAIHAMSRAYASEGPAGLLAAMLPGQLNSVDEPGVFEGMWLTARLHWNYGHLVRSGGSSLPWYSGSYEGTRITSSPLLSPAGSKPDASCGITQGQCASPSGGLVW